MALILAAAFAALAYTRERRTGLGASPDLETLDAAMNHELSLRPQFDEYGRASPEEYRRRFGKRKMLGTERTRQLRV